MYLPNSPHSNPVDYKIRGAMQCSSDQKKVSDVSELMQCQTWLQQTVTDEDSNARRKRLRVC